MSEKKMKLDILGTTYIVKYLKDDPELNDCSGCLLPDRCEIHIDINAKDKDYILFHEVLHAIFPNKNETTISNESLLIYEVLKRNKLIRT